jgi:hypothetical protein
MTLDASTQSTPTAMTSVASALQIPVIFGAEVRWDFPVGRRATGGGASDQNPP